MMEEREDEEEEEGGKFFGIKLQMTFYVCLRT